MTGIPSELNVGGVYLPPMLVAGMLGVLLAYPDGASAESLPIVPLPLLSTARLRRVDRAVHGRGGLRARSLLDQEPPTP